MSDENKTGGKMSGSSIAALAGAIFAVVVMLLFFGGVIKPPNDYVPEASSR